MHGETKKFIWLTVLQYLFYYSGLELNPPHVWGMRVMLFFIFYVLSPQQSSNSFRAQPHKGLWRTCKSLPKGQRQLADVFYSDYEVISEILLVFEIGIWKLLSPAISSLGLPQAMLFFTVLYFFSSFAGIIHLAPKGSWPWRLPRPCKQSPYSTFWLNNKSKNYL